MYESLPWFWSIQYDVKLQIAGVNRGYTELIIRADTEDYLDSNTVVFWYLKDNILLAAECINSAKLFMIAKKLILAKVEIKAEQLSDVNFDIATLVPTVQPA